jgi:hypothetical protein
MGVADALTRGGDGLDKELKSLIEVAIAMRPPQLCALVANLLLPASRFDPGQLNPCGTMFESSP